MDREVKLLRTKVSELSEENQALREINIKFQLENFKLQQKLKNFEDAQADEYMQNESYFITEEIDGGLTEEQMFEQESLQDEEYHLIDEEHEVTKLESSTKTHKKRAHQEAFDEEFQIEFEEKSEDEQDANEDVDLKKFLDADELFNLSKNVLDPKVATRAVYAMAAQKGILDRLKMIQQGKTKDSFFVNKILELLFTRKTLAECTARGQKCQSKASLPVKPALDHQKLFLCKQAFLYRLKSEGLSSQPREERLRCFNSYVNFKVQNSRKLFSRSQKRNLINDQ